MKKRTIGAVLTAAILLVAGAGAEVSAVSDDAVLDTRMLSRVAVIEDQDLDTRSYTVDWSAAVPLNTKKIVGMIMLLR